MMLSQAKFSLIVLLGSGSLATLLITPFLSLDPINLPKMLVVVTGASLLLTYLALNFKDLLKDQLVIFVTSSTFIALLTIALLTNPAPWADQLWGTWGRSTGYLTYFAFIVFMLSVALLTRKSESRIIQQVFDRVSYVISGYALLQALDLDPIAWSQKVMVATLGNINFMSSFLGLASISFLSRLLGEKLSITARVHYSLILLLNFSLIWISGSIQGLAIFASGGTTLVAMVFRKRTSLKKATYWLLLTIPLGVIVFLGTAGIGPLAMLRQETVIYRRDYWFAGINMTKENWLNGVGIDTYGDYYQQYRDLDAVVRTGPQRVTNTAHNIFLDVSSGAGLLAGLSFLAIFAITFRVILTMFKTGNFTSTDLAIAGIFIGFVIFCLISINQIGVGVWGFIFMGYLQGWRGRQNTDGMSESQNVMRRNAKRGVGEDTFRAFSGLITILFGLSGFILSLTPNITDARMLSAVKSENFEVMLDVVSSGSASQAHKEKYINFMLQRGRDAEAYEFALKTLELNQRNELALRVIGSYEGAPKNLRAASLEQLIKQDPNNLDSVKGIQGLIKALDE
jgi:O-antigen ligase